MASLFDSNLSNKFLPAAILSGLSGRELQLMQQLLQKPSWQHPDKAHATFLSKLASCIMLERRAADIDRLLQNNSHTKKAALAKAALHWPA